MNFHILPFGEPAWALRRELTKEKILARPGPPFDFRDMLCLVPNERSVRTLRALFLEVLFAATGARGCVPPAAMTLNRFLERRAFAASKKPVIDRLARELIIEELCAREASGFPSVRPGPALSAMLAEALDRLYLYGVQDAAWEEPAGDSLPLALLRAVKRGYENWLGKKGLADPSAAKAAYRPAPGEFPYRTVILDGFYDADPAEERLMKALAQAPDAHFVLQSAGLQAPGAYEEGRPYHGTDRLLSALGCKEESGSGGGADEASLFIGALFAGRAVRETYADAQGVSRGIKVVGAINAAEEVYFIAREIKKRALGNKFNLNRVLVFFPDPGPYLPALEQAFGDYGIPYHKSSGKPLINTAAARALLNLLSLPLDGYSFRGVRKVLSSPATCLAADGAAAFDLLARRENVPGGRRRWEAFIKNVRREDRRLADTLKRIIELVSPLEAKKMTVREWAEDSLSLMGAAGMEEEARCDGPEAEAEVASIVSAVARLKARSVPAEGAMPLGEFASVLKRLLREARIRPSRQAVSGVRVLARNEIFSEPFDVVFAGGLADGALPAPPRPGLFFPDATAGRLGLPGGREAMARDARLFMGLLLSAPEVFLLYPESGGRGAASPSPYISAFEPFIRAGAVGMEEKWQRPIAPGEALGKGELVRSVSLAGGLSVEAARELVPDYPWPDGEPETYAFPAVDKERFSVTELEEYIFCAYKYYQSRVLGNRPVQPPDDDLDAGTVGAVVHEILHEFVEARSTGEGAEDPLGLLKRMAGARFDEMPDTMANREKRRWFIEKVAPGFIEAEQSLGGSVVAGTEEKLEAAVQDPEGGSFVLTGKIDRIEVDAEGNFVVADYKTGGYPGDGKRPLSEQFQLPLYAHLLRENPDKLNRKMGKPSGFLYYNLRRESGMRDLVYYDSGTLSGGARRGISADGIDRMIMSCLEQAIGAVRGIRAGRFEPEPKKAAYCRFCDYGDACRRKPADAEEDGEGGEPDEAD